MTTHHQGWYSLVDYRPDPTDTDRRHSINLGVVLEFTIPKFWVVGVVVRAGLAEAQLAGLDDLTKRLLEHRSDVITREVDRVLDAAEEPGQALALLAKANPWSINISVPQVISITASRGATVEKALEDYAYTVYVKMLSPNAEVQEAERHVKARPVRGRAAPRRQPALVHRPAAPSIWMMPAKPIVRAWAGT